MNELTTIRKILERLTKHLTKPKGYICSIADIEAFNHTEENAHNPNPATTTTSQQSIGSGKFCNAR